MKVYVDDNEDYRITYSSRDGSECLESMGMQPIIVESLSDYTEQVRKEVCEEIRELANKHYGEEICCMTMETILDQIQGETNVKDRCSNCRRRCCRLGHPKRTVQVPC